MRKRLQSAPACARQQLGTPPTSAMHVDARTVVISITEVVTVLLVDSTASRATNADTLRESAGPDRYNAQRNYCMPPDPDSKQLCFQQNAISLIAGVSTNRNHRQFRHVKLWIGNRMQELLMDNGARVSVLNRKMISSLNPKPVVHSSNGRNLITFTNSPIPIDGVVRLPVLYQSPFIPSFEFFVVKSGNPVMGTDLFNRLGFKVLDPNNVEIPASVNSVRSTSDQQPSSSSSNSAKSSGSRSTAGPRPDSATPGPLPERGPASSRSRSSNLTPGSRSSIHPIVAKFPSIIREDPTRHIKHFQHKPRIDYSVRPVVQAQRRIPLALLDSVEAELRRMQKCDVLEPIETSSWVSNMVVVPKANGAVRLCCDLSDLNKAVIPDRYPLPTVDELSRFFAGSHYFSKIDLKWGYLSNPVASVGSPSYSNDHPSRTLSVEAPTVWTQFSSILLPNGHVHNHQRTGRCQISNG